MLDQNLATLAYDMAPVGIAVAEDRVITACNATFAQMFGYQREELLGQSFKVLYPSRAEYENVRELGLPALRETGRYRDERVMARRDGSLFWVSLRASSNDVGQPLSRVYLSFADLSDRRPVAELTTRERQVVLQLCDGKTSKEIGHFLGISPRTVEAHRARLMKRFKASNTAELLSMLSGMPRLQS